MDLEKHVNTKTHIAIALSQIHSAYIALNGYHCFPFVDQFDFPGTWAFQFDMGILNAHIARIHNRIR